MELSCPKSGCEMGSLQSFIKNALEVMVERPLTKKRNFNIIMEYAFGELKKQRRIFP